VVYSANIPLIIAIVVHNSLQCEHLFLIIVIVVHLCLFIKISHLEDIFNSTSSKCKSCIIYFVNL
jgi:hypothetical protein